MLEGGANPTIRNQITGWVPLHEAAWNGNIDCAKILLQWDAPVMSRTPKVGPVYVYEAYVEEKLHLYYIILFIILSKYIIEITRTKLRRI